MEFAAVKLLLGEIVSLLKDEASLIGGVYDALEELKLELRSMTSFLKDADRKKSLTATERTWVKNVRDMCYPVEDIIEEFTYHLHKEERRDGGKVARLLHKAIHMPKNLRIRQRVAKKIQRIKYGYVIVLDDVWRNDIWKGLENILIDEGLGSRLILTTRNNEIAAAHFGVSSHVLRVKPLEDSEAWQLFCSTAFSSNANKACPKEIESIARDLVRKCNGLPLLIRALGGAMSSKKTVSECRDFQASLGHELINNNELDEVKKRILLFSFKDLSYRLKHYFLYCCIFPKDYPIKRKRLITLWMAEGFIKEVRGKTPEAVADSYLLELVNRNMLQVVEKNPYGRPKICKMHDMMRELALSISEKERFCTVYDSQEAEKEVSMPTRRLSIQTDSINKAKSLKGLSLLRSLFMFISDSVYPSFETNPLPPGLRFLRVLDLEDVPVEELLEFFPFL